MPTHAADDVTATHRPWMIQTRRNANGLTLMSSKRPSAPCVHPHVQEHGQPHSPHDDHGGQHPRPHRRRRDRRQQTIATSANVRPPVRSKNFSVRSSAAGM
jgi:hypothetical protein